MFDMCRDAAFLSESCISAHFFLLHVRNEKGKAASRHVIGIAVFPFLFIDAIETIDAMEAIKTIWFFYPFMLSKNSSLVLVRSICLDTKSMASMAVMSERWLRNTHIRLSVV